MEGANGIGRPLAQRLLADGERVLDVPAKLAARAGRVFDTGQGRKTDATDAHTIVMVALRDKGLREVSTDPELVVLRMLCDRRDELSRARAQALNRMHRLFLELLPGGAPVKKSVSQYQVLLATVRPRDLAGKTRRRMAAEELEDLHRPPGHVLYIAGIVQLRNDTAGRAYYRRKLAAGKTPMEAMRCLRRRLSDAVYRQLAADATGQEEASPGGHPGASLISSAAGLSPDTGTSDQPLPGPAPPTLPPPPTTPKALAPAAAATWRRARGDGVERPAGRTTLTPTSAAAPSTAPGPCP